MTRRHGKFCYNVTSTAEQNYQITVKTGTAISDTCFESKPVNEKVKLVGLFKIKNIIN